jgi:hypothetical protein
VQKTSGEKEFTVPSLEFHSQEHTSMYTHSSIQKDTGKKTCFSFFSGPTPLSQRCI